MVIKFNNELYSIFSVNHRTPGNLRGFVQARMRSRTQRHDDGTPVPLRGPRGEGASRRASDGVLFDDGEYFYFMNTENTSRCT